MSTASRKATLFAGPKDGREIDVHGWTDQQIAEGVVIVVEGWFPPYPYTHAAYAPDPHDDPLRWDYIGPRRLDTDGNKEDQAA